jgi:hypothetical protein
LLSENQLVSGAIDSPACSVCSAVIIIGSAAIPIAKAILVVQLEARK